MPFRGMTRCCLLLFAGCLASPVNAGTLHERVALFLSGQDCPSFSRSLAAELAQVPGVTRVEPDSVPDHVLIDVVSGQVTPDDLLAVARRHVRPDTGCRVEIMQSCISAGPVPPSR